MKLEVDIPEGTKLSGLYWRGEGWGCVLICEPLYWPSKYRQTFSDLRPPEPKFHSCSSGSTGGKSPQEAIDAAFEKLKLTMAFLDGIVRTTAPEPKTRPLDSAAIAGLNLGDIDL